MFKVLDVVILDNEQPKNRRDKTIKQFVVDVEKTGCRSYDSALEYFKQYRRRLYDDDIRLVRMKKTKCYVIYYQVLDKSQKRLSGYND